MIERMIEKYLKTDANNHVLVVLGPWQSGKKTLVAKKFAQYKLIDFQDQATRAQAQANIAQFLQKYDHEQGLIINEFEYVPEIFMHIMNNPTLKLSGYVFISSSNFTMNRLINVSGDKNSKIITLLPLSIHELQTQGLLASTLDQAIVDGGFAAIFESNVEPKQWYLSYLRRLLQHDQIEFNYTVDENSFFRFIKLCALSIGQPLQLYSLTADIGLDEQTVNRWLSMLTANYIIFFHYSYDQARKNNGVKNHAKLYFYDTGIACSVLGVSTESALRAHNLRGPLFENFIIADFVKQYHQMLQTPSLYFWQNADLRVEIDGLIQMGDQLIPLEIKSNPRLHQKFFEQLALFAKSGMHKHAHPGYLIYGGNHNDHRSGVDIVGWKQAGTFIFDLVTHYR